MTKITAHPIALSRMERAGVWIETSMTNFFTNWGITCAKYPVPVIILSVGFAAGLCTGIQWLNVETNPVELWAAPQSRSRVEKAYYDEVFRPFYRTQQVIIHAKNLEKVIERLTGQDLEFFFNGSLFFPDLAFGRVR